MSDLIVDVIAKNSVLYSGNLELIVVPGEEGEIGFMENHEPFVTALKDGVIRGRTHSGKLLVAAIMGGYAQILGRRVIILCKKARSLPSIDLDETKKRYEIMKAQFDSLSEQHIISRSVLSHQIQWYKVMIECKEKEDFYRD